MDNTTLADELDAKLQYLIDHLSEAQGSRDADCGYVTGKQFQMMTMCPDPEGLADAINALPAILAALRTPAPAPVSGDVVERVGYALWVNEAKRAAPNVVKYRTLEQYREGIQSGDLLVWQNNASAALAAMQQVPVADDVRELVKHAYIDGATAVHNSWVAGTNGREPDFGEAASDYAAQAVERLSTQPQADAAAAVEQAVTSARVTLAGHPDKEAPSDQVLAWLANRAEGHARAVIALAAIRAGGQP